MSNSETPTAPTGGTSGANTGTAAPNPMVLARLASLEMVKYLLAAEIALCVLAFVVALPLIFIWLSSGRFKSGLWLTKSKAVAAKRKASPSSTAPRKDPPSSSYFFIIFRRVYNATMLPTVPLINLTIGQILCLLILLGLNAAAFVYKNLAAPQLNFKRPAWISVASLPLVFILSMNNSPFGLIGKGYERVNFIHRFAGRLLILGAFAHYGLWLYMRYSMKAPLFVFEGPPQTGFIAVVALAVILLSSLKIFRSRLYQTFIFLHVTGYITVLGALWFHRVAIRPYIMVAAAAVVFDALQGLIIKTRFKSAILKSVPGNMTKIQVENAGDGWRAGQHVYLRILRGRRMFEKHPFTVANAPSSLSPANHDHSLILVSKVAGDFTQAVDFLGKKNSVHIPWTDDKSVQDKGSFVSESAQEPNRVSVIIEGPYGSFYTDLARYETVVLISGGSGFTYCSAMLEDIVGSFREGKSNTRKVYVTWSLRNLGMVHAFAASMNETLDLAKDLGLEISFRIYTSTMAPKKSNTIHFSHLIPTRVDVASLIEEALESTATAADFRNASRGSGVGVGVCGPTSLINATRKAVSGASGSLESKAGGITLHSEVFGW